MQALFDKWHQIDLKSPSNKSLYKNFWHSAQCFFVDYLESTPRESSKDAIAAWKARRRRRMGKKGLSEGWRWTRIRGEASRSHSRDPSRTPWRRGRQSTGPGRQAGRVRPTVLRAAGEAEMQGFKKSSYRNWLTRTWNTNLANPKKISG